MSGERYAAVAAWHCSQGGHHCHQDCNVDLTAYTTFCVQERREIERALLQGELWGVAATNAMELGVDIGSLDVTLHLGFPGSIASLWQQVTQIHSLMRPHRSGDNGS